MRRRHADVYARTLEGANVPGPGAGCSELPVRCLIENEDCDEAGDELETNPFASVKRPKVNAKHSPTKSMAEDETDKLAVAAEARSPRAAAIVAILYYTGVRVSELVCADVENLGGERGHRILTITRKGGFTSDVVLPPRPSTRSTSTSPGAATAR